MNGIDLNLVREYNFSYGVRNFVATSTTKFSTSKTKFSVQLYTAVSVLYLRGKNT